MRVRYLVTGCAVGLALYLTALGAAGSPAADAAMKGDKLALRTLLQQKADVNLPQADGATAIQWAAYQDDLEMADKADGGKAATLNGVSLSQRCGSLAARWRRPVSVVGVATGRVAVAPGRACAEPATTSAENALYRRARERKMI